MLQIVIILTFTICMSAILPRLQKRVKPSTMQKFLWVFFFVYVVGNMYCTTFSRIPGSGVTVELRPLMSVVRLFKEPIIGGGKVVGFFAWFMNGTLPIHGLILNILLYYPLGYLLPTLFPKLKPKQVMLVGCLCSIATEATQYLLEMGWCETDDVIHNTLGTAIGVWVWYLQNKKQERKDV